MALRLLSSSARLVRSNATFQLARICTSTLNSAVAERKEPDVDTIPTDAEQATGLEKREYEALMAGNTDPFNLSVNKGPPGTKDNPTEVPSMFDQRIVGCICEEDATSITWMILKKGPPQRCDCGHFFKLVAGKTHSLPGED